MNSLKNPKFLVEQLLKEDRKLPKIYMACGDKDILLDVNKDFVAFLKEKSVDVTFEIGNGDHEWDFWDAYIKKAIEWLPTEI